MKRAAIGFAIVIAVVVIAYKVTFPSYSCRYRLHLAVEIEGKAYAGSSVIEVVWTCGLKIADSGCGTNLAGQATVIDLGARGVLVALLHPGEFNTPVFQQGTDARFLCANAFDKRSTHQELPSLPYLAGRRNLAPGNFPYLVWFPIPADMKSARKVTREDISSTIDPTAHFTEAFVEITSDPIVIDIGNKLPWYPTLQREQKSKGAVTQSGVLQLVYNMFAED
jgi:hypothetical protein